MCELHKTRLQFSCSVQAHFLTYPKGYPLQIGRTLTPKPKHSRQAVGRGFTSPNQWRVPWPGTLAHLEQYKRALECGTTATVCCGTRRKHRRQSLRCRWQSRKICSPLLPANAMAFQARSQTYSISISKQVINGGMLNGLNWHQSKRKKNMLLFNVPTESKLLKTSDSFWLLPQKKLDFYISWAGCLLNKYIAQIWCLYGYDHSP